MNNNIKRRLDDISRRVVRLGEYPDNSNFEDGNGKAAAAANRKQEPDELDEQTEEAAFHNYLLTVHGITFESLTEPNTSSEIVWDTYKRFIPQKDKWIDQQKEKERLEEEELLEKERHRQQQQQQGQGEK